MFFVETQSMHHRQWFNRSKPALLLESFDELCILEYNYELCKAALLCISEIFHHPYIYMGNRYHQIAIPVS